MILSVSMWTTVPSCCCQDADLMGNVMTQIDKANGYIYGKAEDDAMRQMYAAGSGFEWEKIATVREK